MSRRELACTNEQRLEQRVAAELTHHGFLTFHNDPGYLPGIPDRYVAGGNWIEFKHVPDFSTAIRKLDRQRTWMDRLEKAGDRVFVCVFLQGVKYLLFEPWFQWKRREQGPIEKRLHLNVYGRSPCVCLEPMHINQRVSQMVSLFAR